MNTWDKIKEYLRNLALPALVILGVMYKLLMDKKQLETKVTDLTRDTKLKEAEKNVQDKTKEADSATADYDKLRASYLMGRRGLRSVDPGVRPCTPGQGSGDKGPKDPGGNNGGGGNAA